MPLSTREMDQWINDSPRNPDLSEYAVGNCALMLQTIPSYSHPAEHGNAALWSGEAARPANQGWTDFNCQCGEGGGSGAECASFAWKHLKDPTSKACLRNMPLEHASALDRRHASVVPFGTWAVGMLRCVPLSVGPSACSGSFVCEVPRSIVAVTSHRSGRSSWCSLYT
jgi:hypothetical protein